MELREAQRLLAGVVAADREDADRAALTAAVADLGRLRGFLDGCAVALAGRLAAVSAMPERVLAAAGRTSTRAADKVLERAKVVDAAPVFADALAAGTLGGEHVDVFGRGLRSLEPALRPQLVAGAAELVAVAERSSPEEFDRAVKAEVRRLQVDDGQARLERQQRATRLRTSIDGDGLWCLAGRFDPDTGVRLHRRLLDAIEARFADTTPDYAPDDPLERVQFLRADALAGLIEGIAGGGGGRGRVGAPAFIAVVDATAPQPDGTPTVDWGLPVELPRAVLCRLWPTAVIHPVVLSGGVVVHAPGALNLGRTTRLANRAQRRALRAMYPTCGLPGCTVPFDHCQIHHVIPWDSPDNGATDLDNLLPTCTRHHHAIHDRGWTLKLTPDRTLTVTYPDGTTTTVRPPMRR